MTFFAGTSGVVHVASNLTFDKDPNAVIPSVISGMNNTLAAAGTEPKVKRFVFTSSSTAATNPKPNTEFNIDENTWNNECVERAWTPPPYKEGHEWDVYGASKTQAEQALWKYVEEKKPHFEVNAVLPNWNTGPILNAKEQPGSTGGWTAAIYEKGTDGLKTVEGIPPQYFVDVLRQLCNAMQCYAMQRSICERRDTELIQLRNRSCYAASLAPRGSES